MVKKNSEKRERGNISNRNLVIGIIIVLILLAIVISSFPNLKSDILGAPDGRGGSSGESAQEKSLPDREEALGCEIVGCVACSESCVDGDNDGNKECIKNGLIQCPNNECMASDGSPEKRICECGKYDYCTHKCQFSNINGWETVAYDPQKYHCPDGKCVTRGPDENPAANCEPHSCDRQCGSCERCDDRLGECVPNNDLERCGDGVCVIKHVLYPEESDCPKPPSPDCKDLKCNGCTERCQQVADDGTIGEKDWVCVGGKGVICDIRGQAQCFPAGTDCSNLDLREKDEILGK